jgi:4-amino-4-deoxy-L-arabinose transferase-like glycosyltransferase
MQKERRAYRDIADRGWILVLLSVALACCFHFYRIGTLPMGLFIDESSIGYNAYLISQTGSDEHGERWPLFFRAFGEYKNPIYIYLVAASYRLFGYSEWATRATSGICWLCGTLLLIALSRRVFSGNTTRLYVAVAASFTPWIFAISRIAFELIVTYPLLALHLLAARRGFDERSSAWAFVSGVALALCVYGYTTFRLLAPIYGVLVLTCYWAPHFRIQQMLFSLGAFITAIPYATYLLQHFDNLTARFRILTYLNDNDLSAWSKLSIFVMKYLGYFSPRFLLLAGDPNLRHHTGFGGELLPPTALLLPVAVVLLLRRSALRDPFSGYVLAGIAMTPIAASLTMENYHSLRAFSMAPYMIVLSAYAVQWLSSLSSRIVIALTSLCAAAYVTHYVVAYPRESILAFENYGFRQTLHAALDHSPRRVLLSPVGNQPYINLLFFGSLEHTQVPLLLGTSKEVIPGDIYIQFDPTGGEEGLYGLSERPDALMQMRLKPVRPLQESAQ